MYFKVAIIQKQSNMSDDNCMPSLICHDDRDDDKLEELDAEIEDKIFDSYSHMLKDNLMPTINETNFDYILLEEEEEDDNELEDKISLEILNFQLDTEPPLTKKKRNRLKQSVGSFWETPWGMLISHPNVNNPRSKEGRMFRRRFRLPFPAFKLLLQLCKDYNIFDLKYETKPPIEAKLLGCLRILGIFHQNTNC